MDRLLDAFVAGLRPLDGTGHSATESGTRALLNGVDALFVVDLEMSGSNAQMHEVMDLGGVRVRFAPGLPEMESWGARVKPRHIGNAEPGALRVIGYNSKAWKNAIGLEAAVEHFTQLGDGAVITGWGIGQDLAFLAETFRRLERPWPFALVALDAQPVARQLLKSGEQVDRFNLGHVADRLGIGRMGEHGALADAFATYDVLCKLVELIDGAP